MVRTVSSSKKCHYITVQPRQITANIGPSGCGKSTFLKIVNYIISFVPTVHTEGEGLIGDENIRRPDTDLVELLHQVGMVFQKPNPFPRSIFDFDNVAFRPRLRGIRDKRQLEEIVEHSLRQAGLWDDVKDRLNQH